MRIPTRALLLAALAFAAVPTPVHAGDAVGASPVNPALHVAADLRTDYLTGVSWLVTLTVRNDGDQPASFPDLGARPHLVHFVLDGAKGRTERFSTPPAQDPGTTWTLPAHSERRVILEVPSSAAFAPGAWKLTVRIADPAGPFELPTQALTASVPHPVGGQPVWEPTVAANTGMMMPWVQQAAQGYDLYLAWSQPKRPEVVVAEYRLAHLDKPVQPVLALSRPSDAQSRYIYWLEDGHTLTAVRLDGQALRGAPKKIGLPYPSVELLDRGVSDSHGGLLVPVWIPGPKGTSGEVRVICISERGELRFRSVGSFPARPRVASSAATSASNLLLGLGDDAGVTLYEVDPTAAPELPARGMRVWKTDGGWSVAGITFDVLQDQGDHPGGLSMLTVLRRAEGDGYTARTLWSDISGKVFVDAPSGPWAAPGQPVQILSNGYAGWYVLSEDPTNAAWVTPAAGTPVKAPVEGTRGLWASAESVYVRGLGGASIVRDQAIVPRSP